MPSRGKEKEENERERERERGGRKKERLNLVKILKTSKQHLKF